jgi:VanZ family protein
MPPRQLPPVLRLTVAVLLLGWILVLALALLAPSPAGPAWLVDRVADVLARRGAPEALTSSERVEFGLNVAAFVPLSLLGALLWPRSTWRDWTAVGFAVSFLVEVVQAIALDARSATHTDVVANTLGTLLGALVVLPVVILLRATPDH